MAQGTDIEKVVVANLAELEIPYELIEIDPAYADTAAFCQQYGYTLDVCGNTIVVASKRGPKQYSACVVLGSDRLDVNKTVRALMGVSRLSFASAGETESLTGMTVGGVTPFALPGTPFGGRNAPVSKQPRYPAHPVARTMPSENLAEHSRWYCGTSPRCSFRNYHVLTHNAQELPLTIKK